jgi:mannose-6-phosphate isomerase-like protein (cupin superfamily)
MKFTKNKTFEFSWEGLKGWAYNSKEDFPQASTAYFEITGRHGKTKTTTSDRVYYVLEGEGIFEIADKKSKVQKTDVVIIPKNTEYDYWTTTEILKLFLVHTPAFDPEKEVEVK